MKSMTLTMPSWHGFFQPVLNPFRRWRMESQVAKLLALAESHKKVGTSNGEGYFKTLRDKVNQLIVKYCEASGEAEEDVRTRMPAVITLEQLASPEIFTPGNKLKTVGKGIMLTVAGIVILGFLTGIGHGVFDVASKLVQSLLGN